MQEITNARLAQLEELGEEGVFRLYLEHGTVKAVVRCLFEPAPNYPDAQDYGRLEYYKWLKQDPGRWDRFREIRKLRGHVEADEALEMALAATPATATAQRVKADVHKWRAERLNREDYGPPTAQVNVAVQVGGGWLEAMHEIVAPEALEPGDPEEPEGA
jgi:hypothetical protein